jgi:hypothetical protein
MVNEQEGLDKQVANSLDANATKQQVVKAIAPLVSTVPNIEKMGALNHRAPQSAHRPNTTRWRIHDVKATFQAESQKPSRTV